MLKPSVILKFSDTKLETVLLGCFVVSVCAYWQLSLKEPTLIPLKGFRLIYPYTADAAALMCSSNMSDLSNKSANVF